MTTPSSGGDETSSPIGHTLGSTTKRSFQAMQGDTPNEVDSKTNSALNTEAEQLQEGYNGDNAKLRSKMWSYFERNKVNGKWKATCKSCRKAIGGDTKNGTSHLRNHIAICPSRKSRDIRQAILNPTRGADGKTMVNNYTFDQVVSRNALGKMIILHEYPLSIVEHHGFKDFCNTLQPLFKVVSRNTVKADILKIYEHEKGKTMELLDRNRSRYAITTDMWTSSNKKRGFMAITAHFVDDTWTLQSRIVRFIYVPCPHTADVLADALMECLLDWNIDRKLSTLTLDNCTTNDAMINLLLDKLPFTSLWLGGKLLHMRCSAHILNLIVKEGLGVISEAPEKVRDSVAYWTATPKRCETFEKVSNQLNIPCTKKLSLDCKTRWNSTYLMLQSALPYKDVFSRLKQRDSLYKCLPLEDDWKLAIEICERLKLFYEVTELFSGTKYPTVNLFFSKIYRIKISMKEWASSTNYEVRMMATNMTTKFEKYWNSVHGVMALGTILDPRLKMRGVEFLFPKIYDDGALVEIEKVRSLAFDVLKEYQVGENNLRLDFSKVSSSQPQMSTSDDDFASEFGMFISSTSSHDVVKCELDYYLEEPVLPIVENFDVLAWWKSNGPKYPTLSTMARDILAIPVSTVASESAFSTSGRFLIPHRSRLHPKTLEALMCAQDWLWNEIQGDTSTSAAFKRGTFGDDNDVEEDTSYVTEA